MLYVDILLIDDDDDEFLILKDALQLLPFTVRSVYACDALNGLEMLGDLLPRYVLIDVNMPKINGLACLKLIKKNYPDLEAKIVMYTSHLNEEFCEASKLAGADGNYQKPDTVIALSNIMKQILTKDEVEHCNYNVLDV